MEVVNAYQSGKDVILLRRDPNGALRRSTATPEYIVYVRFEDLGDDLSRQLSRSQFVRSFKREGPWIRVGFCDGLIRDQMCFGKRGGPPSPFTERGIPTYEGDVSPVRRLLTDQGATIQKPRRGYFDLETDSRVPFSRKEEMRILSWAFVDPEGKRWSGVLQEDGDGAERDLLGMFWEVAGEFDQLLAWNLDNFDGPVLRARTDRTSLRVDPDRWLMLDQLALFKRMNMHSAESGDEKTSMKLEDIGQAVVGKGKLKAPDFIIERFGSDKQLGALTYPMWEAGGKYRDLLLEYNIEDTDLLRLIEKETGYAALFDTLADACRVFPDSRGLHPTHQMDGFMLRVGVERGVHFPTKKYREETEQFLGAFVMEPKCKGIARNVHVCDFASLYPSIILTLNMSPETKANIPINGPIPEGHCRSPSTAQGFNVEADGILPFALRELLRLRKEWNDKKASLPPGTQEWHEADRRSTAYKVAANSFYGVVGSPFSRFFDKMIAQSVTQTGVWLLKHTIEQAEKRGMLAVYGDTDSVFIQDASRTQFEEFVKWCNAELYPKIIAGIGCRENYIKLAYEKQFSRIVFTGAKRYAGLYAHYKGKDATKDSKPEIKGLEFKRGDASLLARRLQEKIIHSVITVGDERVDTYRELLDGILRHVLNDKLPPEEVTISKSVTKPLKEYVAKKKKDGTEGEVPVHVRVAKMLADRGEEVGEGTRIAYVVLDGDGGINKAIPVSDYGDDLDRYYLWESLVYPPCQRFLQAAFPESDWVKGYEKVRPPKMRGKAIKAAAAGQMGLYLVKGESKVEDFVLEINEHTFLAWMLPELASVVKKHPGTRPVVIHVKLETGAIAVMVTPFQVNVSPTLFEDLESFFWGAAAMREWEASLCAS